MKKLVIILASIAMLLPVAAQAAKKSDEPAKVTVMSYNIRLSKGEDGTNSWPYRCYAAATMISDQLPDVFGTQETLPDQIKFITTNFDGHQGRPGYKGVGVGRDNGKHEGEHMMIFYNKKTIKMCKWGTYWLSETPDKVSFGWDAKCRRTATWALLQDKRSGKKFFFVNTHLDHRGAVARKEGLAVVVKRIQAMNPDHYPMVLMGDFNVYPDDPCMDDLKTMMLDARLTGKKTDTKPSYHGWGKESKVIDYIYYSDFSCCEEFQTITKPYLDRNFVSDHNPIKATLVF
ncbi:MAG: endonuclease/exonuclease/phosphatase family protein [Bacteroidales bacterium]|nr:endonuclease/exonuclease/phosphatase family protein [Bacteroidales bacterium]